MELNKETDFRGFIHNHAIGGEAVALRQAMTPQFKEYQLQVLANAKAMASALLARSYSLVSGGTDNHLVLADLKASKGIDGAQVEAVCNKVYITLNKNSVPTDTTVLGRSICPYVCIIQIISLSVSGGVRLGAPTLTSRGMKEEHFLTDEAVEIAREAQGKTKKLKDYKEFLEADEDINKKCEDLKTRVSDFARNPMSGHSEYLLKAIYNIFYNT